MKVLTCPLCQSVDNNEMKLAAPMFPIESSLPQWHDYKNYFCQHCSVVFMDPMPNEELLKEHYNSLYRTSSYAYNLNGKSIDTPIDLDASKVNLLRFQTFHKAILQAEKIDNAVTPIPLDTLVDIGGYQGSFAFAFKQFYGGQSYIYDFNHAGVQFAQRVFDLTKSIVAIDPLHDTFPEKVKFVSLVQVLEHIKDPVKQLLHIRKNLLLENGYLYIEVPNLYGFPLSDPHHLFTYSKESLGYLLAMAGYKSLVLFTDGRPSCDNFVADNPHRKLVCLATPDSQIQAISPAISYTRLIKQLKRAYFLHTIRGSFFHLCQHIKKMAFLISLLSITFLLYIIPQFLIDYQMHIIRRLRRIKVFL